ncbi:MAG: hypothetical protein ABEJ66_01410, partial [Candidatus Nanohaloarchaea archaeon]
FFAVGGVYYFLPQGILTSLAAGLTFSIFGLLGLMLLLGVSGYDISQEMETGNLPVILAIVLAILAFLGAFAFQADISALLGGGGGGGGDALQDVVMPILVLIFILLVVSETTG